MVPKVPHIPNIKNKNKSRTCAYARCIGFKNSKSSLGKEKISLILVRVRL